MPSDGRFTALHRDILLAVVALALLTAPLWVPATNLGEPTYTYERAEVVVDDEEGITYANDTEVPLRVDISENVACSNSWAVRPCGFERYLASNDVTIPSGIYTTNPSDRQSVPREKYRYALVNGTAYETVYTVNRSVQNENGMYRLDLALEPTDPHDALRSMSLRASADHPDVPQLPPRLRGRARPPPTERSRSRSDRSASTTRATTGCTRSGRATRTAWNVSRGLLSPRSARCSVSSTSTSSPGGSK